ncbi:thermonuclease family protein [Nitratireductor sp. CAU 1489]|uniref:Thermonuclease family protein n=1 Tax=Nitratireductor arenosus TaxID=2682096 RepID=A0A844QEL4_9HYPH|nr:thermonuclease family protein [Nitratireductor arenosus]
MPKSGRRGRSRWLRRLSDTVLAAAVFAGVALLVARLEETTTVERHGRPSVGDGDSLTLGGGRIRLVGIDAPELDQTCRRDGADYACGRAARDALRRLVGQHAIVCRGHESDRFGRLLAVCHAGDIDLNHAMVEAGWAVSYGRYGQAERRARAEARGLWAGKFERPRDWRAVHGRASDIEIGLATRLRAWVAALFGAG